MKKAIIIFVRNPEMGKVKTRLAATVGAAAALHVYKKLLQHTLQQTKLADADKFVFYANNITANDIWQEAAYIKLQQQQGNLGAKMEAAFNVIFSKGYSRVLIIGSDCPHLNPQHVTEAFRQLQQNDVAIGPATDGGYYLLGMKRLYAPLFENIEWSPSNVYKSTLEKIGSLGLHSQSLEALTDVDEEKDVPEEWKALLRKHQ